MGPSYQAHSDPATQKMTGERPAEPKTRASVRPPRADLRLVGPAAAYPPCAYRLANIRLRANGDSTAS